MNVIIINKLIEALKNTGNLMIQTKFVSGKPKLMKNPVSEDEVCILVGTTGELEGQVVISLTKKNAKNISSIMMQGMGNGEWDELAKSAMREFGNMTLGTFSTLLSQTDTIIDITPPTLIEGKNMQFSGGKSIKIPIYEEGKTKKEKLNLTIILKN